MAYTVLVVDDEKGHRDNLDLCLRDCIDNVRVDLAEDGQEAYQLFQENPTLYDAVFTDFHMPIMNGGAFLSAISDYDIPLKVMVTAEPDEKIYEDAIQAGVVGIIRKPIDIDHLEQLLLACEEGMSSDKIKSVHQNLFYVPTPQSLNYSNNP
jgi:CheY-like chemotaxis protein